jgi:hypothetical protein
MYIGQLLIMEHLTCNVCIIVVPAEMLNGRCFFLQTKLKFREHRKLLVFISIFCYLYYFKLNDIYIKPLDQFL